MKKFISALTALVFVLPAFANAQSSNADLQNQAQALLQQVAALQAQMAAGGSGSGNTSVNATASAGVNNSACPNIGKVLKRGSTGDDVTRLQQFLALDPSIYPEGTISGYYGALTEKAVQRWQAKYNVVSSGTPLTTGYGVVGPRTAAAIALLCSTGGSAPVGGYIQVSPISGNAPLNVNVNATVNSTNSCSGATYQLSWGDNSAPISIAVSANNCQPISQTYQHTYAAPGTYQIILSSGAHQTGATVTVSGTTSLNSGGTGGSSLPKETFSANPTSGSAPLTVSFSGIVTGADQGWCAAGCSDILVFGDGQQGAVPLPTSQTAAQSFGLQHTYANGATFTAVLYQGQAGNGRPIVGTPITITVNGGTATPSPTPPPPAPTLNPPSITPAVDGNPNKVALTYDYNATTCSFSINWGDGIQESSSLMCSGSGIQSKSSTHTYATAGNYTITLTRDSRIDTAGVNIQ